MNIQFDETFIDALASKIADRAAEMLQERLRASSQDNLPLILTRTEAMEILRCNSSKMAELMNRSDFPVNREFGHPRIPTHMLLKWVDNNTRWLETNSGYFDKEAI